MKTPGTKLPVPGTMTYGGDLLRSAMCAATDISRRLCSGACVRGQFRLRLYEFVWGVNVLTKGVRVSIARRVRLELRPALTLLLQDKEKTDQAGLHGGSACLHGH